MIVLADSGFKSRQDTPANLKICRKGEWNERMLIEADRDGSLAFHRRAQTQKTHAAPLANSARSFGLCHRLAYAIAAYNLCIAWSGEVKLSLVNLAL